MTPYTKIYRGYLRWVIAVAKEVRPSARVAPHLRVAAMSHAARLATTWIANNNEGESQLEVIP